MRDAEVFLVDNGSLRPASIRRLRKLAAALGRILRRRVSPVSVLHSSGVSPTKLDGRRAEIFEPALRRRAAAGARHVVVVPLFIGPSRALTEYLPERVRHVRRRFPGLRVTIAGPLAPRGDDELAGILAKQVRRRLVRARGTAGRPAVLVVDHGSPTRVVTAVRDRVTRQLRERLGNRVSVVKACSMERRPGPAYAFADPLLENVLGRPPFDSGRVILAQLFLLPGRHAGAGGDLASIIRRARGARSPLRVVRTTLLGADPALVRLLAKRARAVL